MAQPGEVSAAIEQAELRIRPHIRTTYLEESPILSEACRGPVHLKLEHLQVTGSFKVRGALSKILSLQEAEVQQGIVTASTGNHGLATAYALRLTGHQGVIYLPEVVPAVKLAALKRIGAVCRRHGLDSGETEAFARRVAKEGGQTFISPYNDLQVIAGQGTIGVELTRQLAGVGSIYIAVGGGGLISGIAAWLKKHQPDVRIIGCLPENSKVMYESIRAGQIVDIPSQPTLSDGTAGGIEADSITFDLCRQLIDDFVLVSEDEIKKAMYLLLREHRQIVEGAAGVAVAALMKRPPDASEFPAVALLCGANVDLSVVADLLTHPPQD